MMPLLTVFTPTYNRRALLPRVYESLKNQTCKDFVWLIVDDGSSDDTESLVREWMEEGELSIRYHYRENGGKMRAHNTGASLCDTALFLCLDSDDELSEDAVERIVTLWKEQGEGNKELSGIVAYKGEKTEGGVKKFRDAAFPLSGESTLRGLYLAGFYGETTLVFRTELLKQYPFPEIEGEKYVPEDYIYDKIDSGYRLLILPEILTVCELVEGGYTDQAARLRRDNPTGWFLYYEQRAGLKSPAVLHLKYLSHYIRFCKVLSKDPFKEGRFKWYQLFPGYAGAFVLWIFHKT